MRLLKKEGHDDFSLTEFFDDEIPCYAILSHTWGKDMDEVSFEDIMEGSGHDKVGYMKLQFCASQALKDGLIYFWVDTCCIKKSSDPELSEAIRSMFRWYQEASRCYVYLSDVSSRSQNDPKYPSHVDFRKSRWFTRGWTLQELLAPPKLQFFSAGGVWLGDKSSKMREISKTTGIAMEALEGSPLSRFSISERLSWAEGRSTRRGEDAAYSLQGIFGVHMPLLYGEGRENAMKRLQKEVEQTLYVKVKEVERNGESVDSDKAKFVRRMEKPGESSVGKVRSTEIRRPPYQGSLDKTDHRPRREKAPASYPRTALTGSGNTTLPQRGVQRNDTDECSYEIPSYNPQYYKPYYVGTDDPSTQPYYGDTNLNKPVDSTNYKLSQPHFGGTGGLYPQAPVYSPTNGTYQYPGSGKHNLLDSTCSQQ